MKHLPGARTPNNATRTEGPKFPETSRPDQFPKSATPSHTNWTAMARIRKPKILLMAPTALGPSRRTNGPPSQKNNNTDRATPAMPITMPKYEAALSTCAASAMTTPIAPGPDMSGIASGVRDISSLSCASWLSSGVIAGVGRDHTPCSIGNDKASGNLQHGQRDAEKMQHESAK